MISGIVLVDGQGAAGRLVLVLSADMNRFLASTSTDPEGRYAIDVPVSERDRSVGLMVKIQGPALAIAYRGVASGLFHVQQDFAFDTDSKAFCTLHAEIVADRDDMPSFLEVAITPARLEGIPPVMEQFFLRRDKAVVDSSYYETRLAANQFDLKMQRGTYRISGANMIYKAPDGSRNFVVGRILVDDERSALPGTPLGGFMLDMDRDRGIRMYVEVLANREPSR